MTQSEYDYQYDTLGHQVGSIEGGGVVDELPSLPRTGSIFDELFLFIVTFFELRIKRYDQIRYWFRTFVDFSGVFCFFGLIIIMAIL